MIQNILVMLIIVSSLIYLTLVTVRNLKAKIKPGCSGGCEKCSLNKYAGSPCPAAEIIETINRK